MFKYMESIPLNKTIRPQSIHQEMKKLRIYYDVLDHFNINKKNEKEFVHMIYKFEQVPKTLEWHDILKFSLKYQDDDLLTYIKNNTNETHAILLNSLNSHGSVDFMINGLSVKMNTNFIIIEFENKDKLYFKINKTNTIRYLGGYVDRKRKKGNLAFKNKNDFMIFVDNYKTCQKYKPHEFTELKHLLTF